MADKNILHMLSPLKHVSPFDVNMALDAGFDAVVPYAGVAANEIAPLVQDAIFSRPPKAGARSGVFIGGKDAIAALDMLDAARQAMVPPFALSLFADPAGSFTTAAALVACVERLLRKQGIQGLRGLRIAVFGATGVVGFAAGVIAALEGAAVTFVGHDGVERVARAGHEIAKRFNVAIKPESGTSPEQKTAVLRQVDAAFCTGRAGTQILDAAQLRAAPSLKVVADVNAVPPLGVDGLDVMADGQKLGDAAVLGIGALAIGQIKYRTEFGLFRKMIEAEKPVAFDFRDAFVLARELAA